MLTLTLTLTLTHLREGVLEAQRLAVGWDGVVDVLVALQVRW